MRRTVGRFTLGVVLLALGIALGLEVYAGIPAMRQALLKWWPLAIVLLGLEYITVTRDPEVNAHISTGAVFLLIVALASAWLYEIGSLVDFGGLSHFGIIGITGTERYTREIDVDEAFGVGVTKLDLHAVGDVTITGASVQSVKGVARVTVGAMTAGEAKTYAEQIKLSSRFLGNTLFLDFTRPANMPKSASLFPSFVLEVPEGSDLHIETVSGSIRVEGVTGRIDLGDVSGNVSVDASPASVDVNLVSGDFRGSLGKSMRELSVKTVSGSVTVEVPEGTGGTVSARTVSGGISDSKGGLTVSKSPGRSQASGVVGTGSTEIGIETVSGSVSFR